MRTLSRALVVAVGLLSIGVLSSSVFANSMPVGTFTLSHPTMWNGTMLPAGEYQFKMTRTQSDVNMLVISGQKQTLNVMVFAQSACESCKDEALKMTVQGNSRIVTAFELPGYHLEFKTPRMENAKETVADSSPWTEQVPVQINSDK
jgi:hypothetical protein